MGADKREEHGMGGRAQRGSRRSQMRGPGRVARSQQEGPSGYVGRTQRRPNGEGWCSGLRKFQLRGAQAELQRGPVKPRVPWGPPPCHPSEGNMQMEKKTLRSLDTAPLAPTPAPSIPLWAVIPRSSGRILKVPECEMPKEHCRQARTTLPASRSFANKRTSAKKTASQTSGNNKHVAGRSLGPGGRV